MCGSRCIHQLLVEGQGDCRRRLLEDLPKDIQDYDRRAVRAIPRILGSLGYEVYRMVEAEESFDR